MIEQLRRLAFVATGAIAGCALQPSPDGSVAGGCAPGGCPACPVCPAQPAALPRVALARGLARGLCASDGAALTQRRGSAAFPRGHFVPWRLANPDGTLE